MKLIIVFTIKGMLSIKFTISALRAEISVRWKFSNSEQNLSCRFCWFDLQGIELTSFPFNSVCQKAQSDICDLLAGSIQVLFYAPCLLISLFFYPQLVSVSFFPVVFVLAIRWESCRRMKQEKGRGEKGRFYYMETTIIQRLGKKQIYLQFTYRLVWTGNSQTNSNVKGKQYSFSIE